MEFDKSRVYTALNADELKVGDKVILADNIQELIRCVNEDSEIEELSEIRDISYNYRFRGLHVFNLAYLVERAPELLKKKWRPFKNIDELIDAWQKKTGVTARANTMPLIWVRYKRDNHKRCMTSFYVDNTVVTGGSFQTMEDLFNEFEFLDGTPCGKEIEE